MSGRFKKCCCGCVEGGKFVYASKTLAGFGSPRYYDPPPIFEKLYRKVNATITRRLYYLAGGTTWTFWKEVSHEIEIELDEIPHSTGLHLKHAIVTGSESGVLYEKTWDQGACDYDVFVLHHDDYAVQSDPNSEEHRPDYFPTSPSVGGEATKSDFSLSDTSITYKVTETTGSPDFQTMHEVVFSETYSEEINPASIAGEVAEMLATIPLAPLSTPNLISLSYDGCGVLQTVTDTISDSDTTCIADEARQQTFTPAAMISTLPTTAGSGTDYDISTVATAIYYFATATGPPLNLTVPTLYQPTVWEATGAGKKSLLQRPEKTDDWIILRPWDPIAEEWGEESCLGDDVTICRRFFFPEEADAGGAESENFTFSGDGTVYREIPFMITTAPCPNGTLPSGMSNPCDP